MERKKAFVLAVFGACAYIENADGGEELVLGKCRGRGEEMLFRRYTRKDEAEIQEIK